MEKEETKKYLAGLLQFIWLMPIFTILGFVGVLFYFFIVVFFEGISIAGLEHEIPAIVISVIIFLVVYILFLKHFQKKGKLEFGISIASLIFALIFIYIIILGSMNSAIGHPRDTGRIGDLRQIQVALDVYKENNGAYPGTLEAEVCESAEREGGVMDIIGLSGAGDSLAGREYMYSANANTGATEYVLSAILEDDEHSALKTDLDGDILGCDCDDPSYCVSN